MFDALLRGLRCSRHGAFSIQNKHYQDVEDPPAVAVGVALHAPPELARLQAPREVVQKFSWYVDFDSLWPLDAARIVARFPRTRKLHLHGVRLHNIAALGALSELVEVHLNACEVPEGLCSFSACSALQELFVTDMAMHSLAVPGQIRTLVLRNITALPNLSSPAPPSALETLRLISCPSLTALTGLDALPRLQHASLSSLPALSSMGVSGPCASLKELILMSCPALTFSEGFPPLPQLQSLCLQDLPGLQVLTGLRLPAGTSSLNHLWLSHCRLPDDPDALADCAGLQGLILESTPFTGALPPALRSLSLFQMADLRDLSGLRGAPQLKSVSIRACPVLASLEGASSWPGLERITIYESPSLSSLSGLSGATRLLWLSLMDCPGLVSLIGAPSAPNLKELYLHSLRGLPSLAGLQPMPQVTQLYLRNSGLTSLDGIGALIGLEELNASGCASLEDVSGLGVLEHLRLLDVRDCAALSDLDPLTGARSLCAVAVQGTQVDLDAVPASMRWLVEPSRVVQLDRLRGRLPPAAPQQPLGRSDKPQLSRIRSLLSSRDIRSVDQGIELLRALGREEHFASLLSGCAWTRARRRNGMRLTSSKFTGTVAPYVLLSLLSASPDDFGRGRAIREDATHLALKGQRNESGRRPFDPLHLECLVHLRALDLDRVGPLVDRPRVAMLPGLERVYLQELSGFEDLAWLSGATGLTNLTLRYARLASITGVSQLTALREVQIRCHYTSISDLGPLLQLPALSQLTVSGCRDPQTLSALRARGVDVRGYFGGMPFTH